MLGVTTRLLAAVCLALSISAHAYGDTAQNIFDASGVRGGLIVHLGCGDGTLTAALAPDESFLVHGLDADPVNVEESRQHIRSLGLYGRVSAETFDGKCLPYVDNLANLVVAEDLGEVPIEEVMRVLAPRGVAYIKQNGEWQKTIKPRPEGIDEWTHYLYDASGNAVSSDQAAGPTRYLKWVAGPLWSRSHEYTPSVGAMVSSDGRIFSIYDDGVRGVTDPRIGDRWMIQARGAFNGLMLWQRPMSEDWGTAVWGGDRNWGTPIAIQRRLVASDDRIYVTLGFRSPVTVLDATTGSVIQELDDTQNTDEMVLIDRTLLVRRRRMIPVYSPEASAWKVQFKPGQEMPPAAEGDETIAAIDVDTGQTLWQSADARIVTLSLAACKGRVCYHNFDQLVCLDLKTGKTLWRADCPSWPDLIETSGTLVMYEDMVFYAGDRGLHAYDAASGRLLWQGPRMRRTGVRHTADLLIADGLLWTGITDDMPVGQMSQEQSPYAAEAFSGVALRGLNPRTGQVERTIDVEKVMSPGHHIRCYRSKGTDRYLMWPKRGTEYVDIIEGRNHTRTDWLRGECGFGIMPSDGLIFVPPHPCICYPGVKLDGFFAAAAEPTVPTSTDDQNDQRLQRGAAYSMQSESSKTLVDDWPMYRHDSARSGAASVVPSQLTQAWQTHLGGKLTQSVIADGRVFVVSTDEHALYALSADDGRIRWSHVAGARIDSAPTVSEGRVLFGSHDGWVYCLRAVDGTLAWRFRAAPSEVRISAFGQLESLWPVLGSVLVHDDVAYVSAGRSSYLDGGMHLYGLEVTTGKVIHHRHLEGPWPDISEQTSGPYGMIGARPDLFSYKGSYLSMGPQQYELDLTDHRAFAPDGTGNSFQSEAHLMASSGFLDDTWHDRTFWVHARLWPGRNAFSGAHQAPKSGQIIVFDESTTYAIKAFTQRHFMSPMHVPGEGYELVADANDNEPGARFNRTAPPRWSVNVPIRARGLLLAGETLFLAGCRDVVAEDDPAAVYEGRTEALLWAVSADDGKKLAELELDAPPVNDGMSAAGGKVFVSSTDGTVTCLAGQEQTAAR